MSVIVGLNSFHADSAACLVVDGKLKGAVAEERLGARVKHTSAFPQNALRWLLADNGLRLSDVTHVAIPRDTSANRAAKMAYVARNPVSGVSAALQHLSRSRSADDMLTQLADICDEDPANARFETVAVEHHLAHIASAYYLSPFDGLTAGFSYDASGDFVSTMAARCEGTAIEVLDRVHLPHSLGFFYTALCRFIGFDHFGEEYKVMGLAPYGEDAFGDAMKALLTFDQSNWFQLTPGYFAMHEGGESGAMDDAGNLVTTRRHTGKMAELLGPATPRGQTTQREMDIARSAQVRFEEAAVHCLNKLQAMVPTGQLAMAGGCALNGVANARILRETAFEDPYLQAASSDDGTCLGAAYWTYHNVVGGTERFHMEHAFWGPHYSDAAHKSAVNGTGLGFRTCADDD